MLCEEKFHEIYNRFPEGLSFSPCHEEKRFESLQRTAVITTDEHDLITSYEEKPKEPKGHLAVPPFYFYRAEDIARIGEALATESGCSRELCGVAEQKGSDACLPYAGKKA